VCATQSATETVWDSPSETKRLINSATRAKASLPLTGGVGNSNAHILRFAAVREAEYTGVEHVAQGAPPRVDV